MQMAVGIGSSTARRQLLNNYPRETQQRADPCVLKFKIHFCSSSDTGTFGSNRALGMPLRCLCICRYQTTSELGTMHNFEQPCRFKVLLRHDSRPHNRPSSCDCIPVPRLFPNTAMHCLPGDYFCGKLSTLRLCCLCDIAWFESDSFIQLQVTSMVVHV